MERRTRQQEITELLKQVKTERWARPQSEHQTRNESLELRTHFF